MKRSDRLLTSAKESLLTGILTLILTVAIGCWVPGAWMKHPALGLLAAVALIIGIIVTAALFHETARLLVLAEDEQNHERRTSIRPRL